MRALSSRIRCSPTYASSWQGGRGCSEPPRPGHKAKEGAGLAARIQLHGARQPAEQTCRLPVGALVLRLEGGGAAGAKLHALALQGRRRPLLKAHLVRVVRAGGGLGVAI